MGKDKKAVDSLLSESWFYTNAMKKKDNQFQNLVFLLPLRQLLLTENSKHFILLLKKWKLYKLKQLLQSEVPKKKKKRFLN